VDDRDCAVTDRAFYVVPACQLLNFLLSVFSSSYS
jgi:hypothetical protein